MLGFALEPLNELAVEPLTLPLEPCLGSRLFSSVVSTIVDVVNGVLFVTYLLFQILSGLLQHSKLLIFNYKAKNLLMKTLLTDVKWCRFEPSDDLMNPYLQIITHKTRPVLSEVLNPNIKRSSLSALLNSKKVDPLVEKESKFFNNLHKFERTHVQSVSTKAPTKNVRPYSSLRAG